MSRGKKILIMAMTGVMLLSTSCSKPSEPANSQATPTPEQKQMVEAFGVIKVTDKRDINLDFAAVVEQLLVKEGQKVKQDEPLLKLDINDYETQIRNRQHDLNSARLEVKKLQNQLKADTLENNDDPDVKKLLGDLQFAENAYQKALKEQEGQEALYKAGSLSQHDYDEFQKAVDSKKKDVEDINHELSIALNNNQKGNKEIYDSMAIQNEKVASVESEIETLKNKINKAYIKDGSIVSDVPNGIVYEIGYSEGDVVSSEKKLLSIMNLDSMIVEADVAEEFIKDVKVGAGVEIVPLADKSKKYKGKVTRISGNAVVQNGETVIPVEISIDNKDDFLLPNFNVDVSIAQD